VPNLETGMKIRIKDIAKKAGVSTGTVDRILHNRGNVSEMAREAVEKVLKEVNYKPNIHISSMSLKRRYKVIITTPTTATGEYWASIHKGISRVLDDYSNIKIDLIPHPYNQYDIYSCQHVFKQVATEEADGVIIGPTFTQETIALTTELDKKSIPYIFVDSMVENTNCLAFFSADHYTCGYLMCKLLTQIIPEKSEIGILQAERIGNESANTTILRKNGLNDYLKEKKLINKVRRIPFSVTEPERNDLMLSKFFHEHQNIGGVVVLNSRGNVVANYFEQNKITDIRLVCIDATNANTKSLKAGLIDFLICQEPERQGISAIKMLIEFLIYRQTVQIANYVPLDILTKETIDYYRQFNRLE
jgi:LacI family transcriptional regulator